jgi:Putative prokaryotic signal transducing protein
VGTRLVTIATFDQPWQARLAKNALDEAGILTTVRDETLVATDRVSSDAVGGVKVQVLEKDADRAAAVLAQNLGDGGERARIAQDEAAAAALVWSTIFGHGFWL